MDRYNAEGYPDPTAEALENIMCEEKAKTINLAFLFVHLLLGIQKKSEEGQKISEVCSGARNYSFFAPHLLYPQVLDDSDPEQRKLGLFFGMVWLRKCEELWVFGRYISKGMQAEINKASKHRIPIRYFSENCEEVQKL